MRWDRESSRKTEQEEKNSQESGEGKEGGGMEGYFWRGKEEKEEADGRFKGEQREGQTDECMRLLRDGFPSLLLYVLGKSISGAWASHA